MNSDSIKNKIKQCRKLIEQHLNWESSAHWTRRDYELLIEKIFTKTGVLLSLSTVRRIWNDDFKNIPHKSTLDALAEYAGFLNWQDFIESHNQTEELKVGKKNDRSIVTGSFVVILIIVLAIVSYDSQQIKIIGPVSFKYTQKNDSTVPNIIVFDYDVQNIVADSFFIVESTNDYRKKKLLLKKGQLTSSYYHPGNFETFLVADDSIVRKLNIEILSNSWIAMLNYHLTPENVPFYFYEYEIINFGKLGVTRDKIINNNIKIKDDLYLSLTHTFNSNLTALSNFTFRTKIKLDSIEINSSCPEIYLGLLFEHDFCYIPITHYGGQDKLQLKFGDTYQTSNDSDLSGFGCNIYEWQEIKFVSTGSDVEISLNNEIVTTLIDTAKMGAFKGFSFTFDGIGSVDYISLLTFDNDTIYFNSFNEE